jgi:hypothetical protein
MCAAFSEIGDSGNPPIFKKRSDLISVKSTKSMGKQSEKLSAYFSFKPDQAFHAPRIQANLQFQWKKSHIDLLLFDVVGPDEFQQL